MRPMTESKTVLAMILVAAVLTLFSLSLHAQGKGKGKVLVLGFETSSLSDIQDRLLRETVMRDFDQNGYAIVPVMQLEYAMQESRTNIRKISREQLKNLCLEFGADCAITGIVSPGKPKGFPDIILYRKETDKFIKFGVAVETEDNFYEYCFQLSTEIVKKVDAFLEEKAK